MDIDFHYHATYAAARFAGFTAEQALIIATSAQMIDENGRHVLKESTGVTSGLLGLRDDFELREDPKGPTLHTFRVQMTFQGLGDIGTSNDDTLASIWPVYHFLPGNFAPSSVQPDDSVLLEERPRNGPGAVRSALWEPRAYGGTNQDQAVLAKFRWLCRPHSPMAIALINNCTDLCQDKKSEIRQNRLKLYLIGVTMHVFIDTWAHQDFVGPASKAINSVVGTPAYGWASSTAYATLPQYDTTPKSLGATLQNSAWKGTAPSIGGETSNLFVGHGQVGHWPDHSSLIWGYQPAWKGGPIIRNNPLHYFDAFCHMVYAMCCIRGNFQYRPFQLNSLNLQRLYALSAKMVAKTNGVPLTAERLKAVNKIIQKQRDPWGDSSVEVHPQISDEWDRGIFGFGRQWQLALRDELGLGDDVTTDWTPGKSAWVRDALQSYQLNKKLGSSQARAGDWLTIGQFLGLDFFKFNLAAKFHYRFVKQQLTVFGESLLGNWADGAAYADDFLRIESTATQREIKTWRVTIFEILSQIQREATRRDLSEGFTILISEMEGVTNAREAVGLLRRAIDTSTQSWQNEKGETLTSEPWNYGLDVGEGGVIKDTGTLNILQKLISDLERTRGFADQHSYLPLPTYAEWESRSSVFFALRSSDPKLVQIDKSLAETHLAIEAHGLSDPTRAQACASKTVEACLLWLKSPGPELKRKPAVQWLCSSLQDWLNHEVG